MRSIRRRTRRGFIVLSGRRRPRMTLLTHRMRARVKELQRKLGHPLRLEIEGRPLTDEEIEEVVLARLMDHDFIPASRLLEEFRHSPPKNAK